MVDPIIICSMRFLQYYSVSKKNQLKKDKLIRILPFKYNHKGRETNLLFRHIFSKNWDIGPMEKDARPHPPSSPPHPIR